MNECRFCGGTLEPRSVERVQQYNGHWYLIQHVPALVCRQCGEIYYTPEAHDLVLKLVSSGAAPVRVEQLDVLDARQQSA
jgi:HTH-type transcriptional regulator / antitoxin MqsA